MFSATSVMPETRARPTSGFEVAESGSGAVASNPWSAGATVARNAALGTVPVCTEPSFFRDPS